MKNLTLFVLIFISIISFGQTNIPFESLKYEDGKAIYQGKPFTGSSIEITLKKKGILYKFQNGLLDCCFRKENEFFNYKNGIVLEYKYFQPNGDLLFYFNNLNSVKKVSSIRFGIQFDTESNDTVYIKNILNKEFVEFKIGAVLKMTFGKNDFIEAKNIEFISATVRGFCSIDWWYHINSKRLESLAMKRVFTSNCERDIIDLDDIFILNEKKEKIQLNPETVNLKE